MAVIIRGAGTTAGPVGTHTGSADHDNRSRAAEAFGLEPLWDARELAA